MLTIQSNNWDPAAEIHLLTRLTVSPRSDMTSEITMLYGKLNTTPTNSVYIEKDCPSTEADDKENCIIVEHAGLAYELQNVPQILLHIDYS